MIDNMHKLHEHQIINLQVNSTTNMLQIPFLI